MTNIEELLDRYVEGRCSSEEKSRLEAWYELQVKNNNLTLTDDQRKYLKAKLKNKINDSLHRNNTQSGIKRWLAVAAIFVAVVSCVLIYYRFTNPIEDIHYHITSVPFDKRATLTLSDGSIVVLNSSTKIRYPESFGKGERRVFLLEGEAYFDIKSDTTKPFIVESGELETKVLGTAFNIKYLKDAEDIRITVARGRVQVSDTTKDESTKRSYILLSDDQISFHRGDKKISQQKVFSSTVSSWREGNLIFDNDRLSSVVKTLSKKYNTAIRFNDETIKDYYISGVFKQHETLEDVLFAISKSSQLSYKEKDNTITLYLD